MFTSLPPEIALNILARCDLGTLAKLMLVARRWRGLVEDDFVWQRVYFDLVGSKYQNSLEDDLKLSYKEKIQLILDFPPHSIEYVLTFLNLIMMTLQSIGKSASGDYIETAIDVVGARRAGKSSLTIRFIQNIFVCSFVLITCLLTPSGN